MALHPKVTAGVVAGAIVGLLVSEAKRRGLPIEADEASNLTTLVMFAVAFLVPSNGNGGADQLPAPPLHPAGVAQ